MSFGIFNKFRRPDEPGMAAFDVPQFDPSKFFPEEEPLPELPENQALQAFGEHAMNVPQRDQFKNNFLTKLAAGLVGASEGLNRGGGAGATAGREILDRNYINAIRDHATQGQALRTQADIEQEGIGQQGRVLEMKERSRSRAADRGARMYDYESRERDRRDQAKNRETDNQRAEREFAERQRSAKAQEALEGRRIEAYGGMGRRMGKLGPQARIPVDQYDKARQLAIEQILVEDPSAQKFFSNATDEKGNPTGYMTARPDILEKGFFKDSNRALTPEESTHRANIQQRIEAAMQEILGTMVDPYDREDGAPMEDPRKRKEPPPFKQDFRGILSR